MVTIKDIARKCGVSPATVSKALNGYADINPSTAERIRKIARELHYRPNAAARQLKTNRSHDIGVLFVDDTMSGLTHQFFSTILNSAKAEFESHGYSITFISQNLFSGSGTFLEHARHRNCDGVLIASVAFDSPQVKALVESEIPTMTIDYAFPGHSAVMSDNVGGFYALTQYLLSQGHRRIGVIHGENTLVTRKRLNGFYRAMREVHADVPPEYVIQGIYNDPESSAAATKMLMALPQPPTAIMYPDDFSSIGGRNALEKMGLSVPEDVSITGYDGILLSQVIRPKLTTYYQDAPEIGRASAGKLIEAIESPETCVPEQILVHGSLLEGGSINPLSE